MRVADQLKQIGGSVEILQSTDVYRLDDTPDKIAVVEGMDLSGFGAHSNDAEYVQINSIVPRLYLTTRMIMDLSTGKLK